MKKKPASKSAFFNQRVLIGFSFCLIGLVLALAAFNAYPGGNAFARQEVKGASAGVRQNATAPASKLPQLAMVEDDQAVDSSIIAPVVPPHPDVIGATFVVNTTNDTADAAPGDGVCLDGAGACSLRAAISEANALAGADTITLPAGTYTTTLVAANEDLNAGGDFDIRSDVTINGAGSATTIIQANAAPNTATEKVIHITTATATAVNINNVTIRNGNSTVNTLGGGVRIDNAANVVNFTNCIISGNRVIIAGNAFAGGLGITAGSVTLTGCTISGNSAVASVTTGNGFAGGIYNQQATVNLVNSTLTGNFASSFHGGVRALASTTAVAITNITNSTISNNQAQGQNTTAGGGPGEGGGLVNIAGSTFAATMTVTGSTINGNAAQVLGVPGVGTAAGGIENFSVSTGPAVVNVTNSTISGNTAEIAGGGYSDGAVATVTYKFSTIASNSATGSGGGIYQDVTAGGVTNLKDSIVADNTATTSGNDIFGTITSQNYNHLESTAGGTFAAMANDVVSGDPALGALANNGGPTFTHLPGGASVVLNTIPNGTNECGSIAVDQRALVRPSGAGCEKGSVEVQVAASPTPSPTPSVTPTPTTTPTPTPSVTPSPGGVPANDQCAGAIVIPPAGPFPFLTAAVDVTNATITGDPPLPSCQTSVSRSIWYTFTPAVTGSYTISSCQTDAPACTLPDDVIAIYTSAAGCAGPFTQLAGVAGCDDDSCTTLALQAIISNTTLNAGTQYYIVAQKFNTTAPTAGAASIQFRVSLATPASPTPTPSGTITPPASPTPGVSVVWGMWTTPATGAGTARLVTFSPTAPQTFTIIGDTGINTTSNFPNGLDFDAANNLFATGGTNTNFLFSVNQTTGLATVIGGSGLAAGQTVVDLAFDRFNNRMLAIGSGTNPVLLQINTATGAATALGTITGTTETVAVSLAVRASDGAIFMHGVATDRWYNVNPTTFVATPLAVLPFDTNFGQGGTFDPNNGTLYHAAFNSTAFQGQLWTIDPATGTATFVGNMGDTTNPQPNQVSDIAIKLSGPPATPTPTPSISPGITPTPPPSPTPTPTPSATPSPCGVNTFTNSAAITIPDSGPGVPYPSNISVAGLTGTITKVTVTLNSLSHTFPSDVDILLVSPGGQNAIIMSDVGGGNPGITGVTFTLDDAAAAPIPATNFVAGMYRPTNSGTGDTFPAPAPAPAGGSPLSVFNGGAPNGTWALYVVDDAALDLGNLSGGWTLNISTTTGTCATPTPGTPTPSPSCPPASNVIVDGTFEAGTPWTAWTVQTSTNFGTPMCDAGCGTGGGTAGGFGGSANWAWFGGTASAETATTGQSVVIASGGSASLTFQLWIGAVNTPFTDVLNVRVDGTIVATFTEPTTAEVGYTLRTVNLNAFANGASHAILFEYIGPGGAVSNFSVDNISLTAGGTCATPTPSASPSASPSCAPGWSAGPVFPTAAILRAPGNYFPANGRFYSIGGRTSDLVGSDTTHPFEYDPVANSWATKPSTLPDLQVNNMACGVLTVSGTPQIYCVGGSQATVVGNASRVFSYNPATDTFTTLAAGDNWPGSQAGTFLPGGFAVNGNKLYIIGSFNANAVPPVMTNQVWQFDPTAAVGSKWVARANYPQARGYVPAASIGGFIYTGGGAALDGAGTLIDSVESFKYDVTGDAWTAIANIPRATGETRAVVMNGTMWVLGGGRTPPNPGAQVDIFDPVAGTWSAGLPLDSIGRRNFPADSNGTDRIFLAGGYDNLASQVNTMRIFGAGACASPTPSPSIAPSATPSATIGVSPTPGVSPSPGVSPTPGVSPSPGVSPTPGASATPGVTPPAQAVNFSTRMRVLTGDRVGIGGFIVTGSGPKNVLVRAIGPSLVRFGIDPADVLADPTLELHGPTGFTTVNNNNWKENPVQRDLIEATGLPPTNDLESAIVATLNPGQYTAVVKGNGNTTGVALVEVYDLNQSSGSKLANISTRAFVSVDDDIVIAGFILGNSPGVDSIIVRGIGPSLAAFGVSTVLANPTLELRDNNGSLLFANNDWQDNPAQAALITAAGLAPSNNLEAAIAATLPPGLYTALLAGLNGGTGNGLVEVYDRGAAGGGGPAPTPTPSPTPPGGTPSPSPSVSPGISPSPTPPGVTPTPTPPASPTPSPATCTEAFDGVTAPALPAGWTASNEGSPPDNGVRWVTNTLTPDSAPNSAFVDDQNGVSDKYMVTRNIAINSGAPKITFRNFFSTEYDPPPTEEFWDGYVLEISRDNGATWADITDPAPNGGAGTFVTGGYTGEINGIASNPLAGRQAWSGENTGYISTEINLGSHLNGQTVKLRFRMGSDLFSPGDGVHVDSLVINGGACP